MGGGPFQIFGKWSRAELFCGEDGGWVQKGAQGEGLGCRRWCEEFGVKEGGELGQENGMQSLCRCLDAGEDSGLREVSRRRCRRKG